MPTYARVTEQKWKEEKRSSSQTPAPRAPHGQQAEAHSPSGSEQGPCLPRSFGRRRLALHSQGPPDPGSGNGGPCSLHPPHLPRSLSPVSLKEAHALLWCRDCSSGHPGTPPHRLALVASGLMLPGPTGQWPAQQPLPGHSKRPQPQGAQPFSKRPTGLSLQLQPEGKSSN